MTTPLPTALDEPWHGTLNGYNHKKCRCKDCKYARRVYLNGRRKQNRTMNISGNEHWHGTAKGYTYYQCRCADCRAALLLWRKSHREKIQEKNNGDEPWHGTMYGYEYARCRCESCRFARKIYGASNIYGISQDRVKQLLSIAECEICGTNEPDSRGWCIDHDHSCCDGKKACGKCVRGLLCQKCNTIIGFANDDLQILKAAISYLERYSA